MATQDKMSDRAFHRNAIPLGLKKLGAGENLQFNVKLYELRERVFTKGTLDEIIANPPSAVGYGPDSKRHDNLKFKVVKSAKGDEVLQIENLDAMRKAYEWNADTAVTVYYYTSGIRSNTKNDSEGGGGGGKKIHNLLFAPEPAGCDSCSGCGVNL